MHIHTQSHVQLTHTHNYTHHHMHTHHHTHTHTITCTHTHTHTITHTHTHPITCTCTHHHTHYHTTKYTRERERESRDSLPGHTALTTGFVCVWVCDAKVRAKDAQGRKRRSEGGHHHTRWPNHRPRGRGPPQAAGTRKALSSRYVVLRMIHIYLHCTDVVN